MKLLRVFAAICGLKAFASGKPTDANDDSLPHPGLRSVAARARSQMLRGASSAHRASVAIAASSLWGARASRCRVNFAVNVNVENFTARFWLARHQQIAVSNLGLENVADFRCPVQPMLLPRQQVVTPAVDGLQLTRNCPLNYRRHLLHDFAVARQDEAGCTRRCAHRSMATWVSG